jgi:hypothetical protein
MIEMKAAAAISVVMAIPFLANVPGRASCGKTDGFGIPENLCTSNVLVESWATKTRAASRLDETASFLLA